MQGLATSGEENKIDVSNEKINMKEYFAYFSYGFGQCFSFGLVGTFILFFYTDILGISAVAASIIFLVARIWDAVIDPIVAGFMDTRRTKHGKFRGYMKFTPILIVVSTIFCFFSPDISVTGKVIYAGATYILWGTIYAFSDIPFWSLSTVISKNGQDRTKLLTVANLGVYGGIGMVGFLVPILIATFNKNYTPSVSYLITVGIIMVAAYILMFIGYKYTKERVVPEHNEKVTFKDVIESAKVNKYMFKILLVFFLNIFMNIVQGIILYFFTYNLNAPQLMSVFGIIGTLSAVGFLFIPLLTKYFKKRNILRTLLGMDIIIRLIFFLVGYESIVLVITFLAITQLLYSATGPIISAMLSETVEYSEVKTGKRTEAIVFGGQTFAGKLSVALAGAFTGLILTLIGYQANVEQTEFTLSGLFIVVSILPALGSLLRLLVLSKYDYTEVEFNECLRIIQERKSKEV
ncbi:MFS transporter [Lederbergia lenta]|uniref:GPH family glycoside-pentoside-hexuronide:cation symporter n=1 Tax=Lederbergia lenta TaxID=1467 RepID=A0A2X4YMM0_LEDLE|nr:MFS transporter [Lederbergia lenta]MEC2323456.1 MFS transporter [Lederbergia lenta]SQI52985.1 GPH family glycoside-pentoside-hexuronide:cation symporter [Lederbergia lenta]